MSVDTIKRVPYLMVFKNIIQQCVDIDCQIMLRTTSSSVNQFSSWFFVVISGFFFHSQITAVSFSTVTSPLDMMNLLSIQFSLSNNKMWKSIFYQRERRVKWAKLNHMSTLYMIWHVQIGCESQYNPFFSTVCMMQK